MADIEGGHKEDAVDTLGFQTYPGHMVTLIFVGTNSNTVVACVDLGGG